MVHDRGADALNEHSVIYIHSLVVAVDAVVAGCWTAVEHLTRDFVCFDNVAPTSALAVSESVGSFGSIFDSWMAMSAFALMANSCGNDSSCCNRLDFRCKSAYDRI